MTTRFEIQSTPIADLQVLVRKPRGDSRGFLERMYCTEELLTVLGNRAIKQINRTLTHRIGTVRGLHFQQAPFAETKLVACLRGELFDVAVDIRPDSPTFLHWHGEILSAENSRTLLIPEGFAHGFQTLRSDTELLYFHTSVYMPTAESGIDAIDRDIAIDWPLPIEERSDRDQSLPSASAVAANLRGDHS